ncbi:MAG TPA: branched-chain amino acid ABC transporter substrate-binding protein, partial [Anaerolineae bacterium]|nr:branched-chain amino acid ABC transporter substrate-binding protein [Anaerolineae bacterium]
TLLRLTVLAVIFSLLLAACGGSSESTKGELIVYVGAPLSGFQANGGQTVLGGVRLAAEEFNRAGGLLGYKVVVVPLDDESDSNVAVALAEQVKADLAAGKRVLGVVGHYNSGQTIAAMDVYKDLPIVVLTPTSSEMSLTQQGYGNFFRVNANDATQARIDAAFLVNKLKAKRVSIVHNDDPYGVGLAKLLSDELDRLGAKAITNLQVKVEQSEYSFEVQQIKTAAPDAIFYAGYEVETPYLRNALVKAGVLLPFMASDGAFLSATIDESDNTAEGMYLSSFAPQPSAVVDKAWIAAYQAVEYRNPDTYSINGYSAMKALGEAVKKANAIDAKQVANALRSIDLTTPVGKIAYDASGDLKDQRIYIFQVQKVEGELQFVQMPQ